jgi:negative regulator of flagellin synthesis FlgM
MMGSKEEMTDMRIEAYTQVQQAYKATYTNKAESKQNAAKSTDNVQISSFGKEITSAMQALKEAPDIREDVVNELREKIDNGTYDIDPDSFAEKLWQKYAGLL